MGAWLDQGDQANEQVRREAERREAEIAENRRLMESLRRAGADATVTERGVRINLPDILFGFDRSDLTADARQLVGEISGILRERAPGREVLVEGHTDSVGSEQYNQSLSERRADAAARALIANGVNRRLVRSKGFGEYRPIASNDTDAGRQRNRRVEIVVR
jgi:outer membrane protein OmpA-like peptidoglycan-associated protein